MEFLLFWVVLVGTVLFTSPFVELLRRVNPKGQPVPFVSSGNLKSLGWIAVPEETEVSGKGSDLWGS